MTSYFHSYDSNAVLTMLSVHTCKHHWWMTHHHLQALGFGVGMATDVGDVTRICETIDQVVQSPSTRLSSCISKNSHSIVTQHSDRSSSPIVY